MLSKKINLRKKRVFHKNKTAKRFNTTHLKYEVHCKKRCWTYRKNVAIFEEIEVDFQSFLR